MICALTVWAIYYQYRWCNGDVTSTIREAHVYTKLVLDLEGDSCRALLGK
jgi:hypothetical protein